MTNTTLKMHLVDLVVEIDADGDLDCGLNIDCVSGSDAECQDENLRCRAVEFFVNCEHGARDMYAGDPGEAISDSDRVHVWQTDDHEWHWKLQAAHDATEAGKS